MAKKTQLFGKAPLTIVRTNAGSAAYVYKGRPAPGDISAEERKRLLDENYLEERDVVEEDTGADGPGADTFDVTKGGNIKDTLAWVDGDKGRAEEALKVEQAKPADDQRGSLVTQLEALIDA